MNTSQKCLKMRQAKAARRLASVSTPEVSEAGRAVFSGILFGYHTVRILARSDTPHAVYVEVDGRVTCSKTPRGARALLMRRLSKPLNHEPANHPQPLNREP